MIRQHNGRAAAGLGAYYAERENLPIHGLGISPDGLGAGCVPCGLTEEQRRADEAWMQRNRGKVWVGIGVWGLMMYGLYRLATWPSS